MRRTQHGGSGTDHGQITQLLKNSHKGDSVRRTIIIVMSIDVHEGKKIMEVLQVDFVILLFCLFPVE